MCECDDSLADSLEHLLIFFSRVAQRWISREMLLEVSDKQKICE